ncbi:DnaJ domain-containing protein [Brucella pseudogrignonensis]|jgi:DnaJ-class molecular chaperone|uniref:DnaJ C terminal domain protein n=2 Tax=Brucella TaxID=234 RepID=A0A1A9FI11_9HYPH|nr:MULTISPECIES: DnaJ C-terminal domain-containing protein [Brucella]EMG55077.1 chaperone protein DNAJ [Ochrobactrum sp. CDB2]MBK0020411.1 J domain-containing protein [Ochrobactrum sp. S45]MBK0042849.1 J domain-containing protein [Ochrobactrum sp. S46]MBO1024434.1 J domain-containing protein [Ochrobactrum sp. SD129]QWK78066.1 DnaJ domain-containing protein [Ochrobactrum sp. BTU1]
MRDPYSVLGVAKTAKPEEIKSAFRKLAKKHHPDQNQDDPKAQERFAEVNQAYEIVGDKDKRGQFDRGEIDAEGKPLFQGFAGQGGGFDGHAGFGGGDPFAGFRQRGGGQQGGFGGAEDILNDLFGGAFGGGRGGARQQRGPVKGSDLSASINITLEQAAGADKVEAVFPNGKHLKIKLPQFVEDGQTIRLKGQGEHVLGGTPGDALVTIHFKQSARFRLEGRDVHVDLPVELEDAVLGGKAEVETLSGRIAVKVPAWSNSDKVLRLKGKGLPLKAGGHGDLYVHVRIMLPEGGDAELEEFLRKRKGE